MIQEAVVWMLVLPPSELQKGAEVVGCSFEVVCCVKGVEVLSGIILEEAWVLVQPSGKYRPGDARRINWDWKYRRVKLVRDF